VTNPPGEGTLGRRCRYCRHTCNKYCGDRIIYIDGYWNKKDYERLSLKRRIEHDARIKDSLRKMHREV